MLLSHLGFQLLALLVPILISYLLDGNSMIATNKHSLALHDISLKWLMKIGPMYPEVCILRYNSI